MPDQKPVRKTTKDFVFNFDLDDKVTNRFGSVGFVNVVAFDHEGPNFHVEFERGEGWYRTRELRHATSMIGAPSIGPPTVGEGLPPAG